MVQVNFDNAATTFPKPDNVKRAMVKSLKKYGGNPGRSGHKLSLDTANEVYKARRRCAEFFSAETENTIFTQNCTHALNLAIKGIMADGGHIIISDMEHNSVLRPVHALSQKNCRYSIAKAETDDRKTIGNFESLIQSDTVAVVCTAASNVTGQIMPYDRIAEMCRKRGICFILDGAQGCGILPIEVGRGINFICAAGHKGLYGPSGTGLLVSDGLYTLGTIVEGGTGSLSMLAEQPDFLPDRLESGTVNTVGAIALGEGVRFVETVGREEILRHETELCDYFADSLLDMGVTVYRKCGVKYAPVVSFNVKGRTAEETASLLDEKGFCLRGGLHCSGMAHTAIGTAPDGTVRFSPSVFNHRYQVRALLHEIKKIL